VRIAIESRGSSGLHAATVSRIARRNGPDSGVEINPA
jgi:hypothetical protein